MTYHIFQQERGIDGHNKVAYTSLWSQKWQKGSPQTTQDVHGKNMPAKKCILAHGLATNPLAMGAFDAMNILNSNDSEVQTV